MIPSWYTEFIIKHMCIRVHIGSKRLTTMAPRAQNALDVPGEYVSECSTAQLCVPQSSVGHGTPYSVHILYIASGKHASHCSIEQSVSIAAEENRVTVTHMRSVTPGKCKTKISLPTCTVQAIFLFDTYLCRNSGLL